MTETRAKGRRGKRAGDSPDCKSWLWSCCYCSQQQNFHWSSTGTGWDGAAAGQEEALRCGTRKEEQQLQNCPETLEPLTPSSLSLQPLAMPRAAHTALPCAQDHQVFIIHLWLLLSSCSSKFWESRNRLCYRKVKPKTAGCRRCRSSRRPAPVGTTM